MNIGYRVILLRGPHKPDVEFKDLTRKRAWERALALAELHGTSMTPDYERNTFTVNASEYYKPRETAKRLLLSVL